MTRKVLTDTDDVKTPQTVKYNDANQLPRMANGEDAISYGYDKNGSMVRKTLSSKTYLLAMSFESMLPVCCPVDLSSKRHIMEISSLIADDGLQLKRIFASLCQGSGLN